MKITKSKLKQIIKEELKSILNETEEDEMEWEPEPPPWSVRGPHEMEFGRETADEPPDPIEQLAVGGQSTDEVLDVLRQLFDLVRPEDAQRFADEAQSLAQAIGDDEPPFRGPDPRKTAELRQQTRAQGGYSGKGAWKPREPNK